jgi:hypothetical protein
MPRFCVHFGTKATGMLTNENSFLGLRGTRVRIVVLILLDCTKTRFNKIDLGILQRSFTSITDTMKPGGPWPWAYI